MTEPLVITHSDIANFLSCRRRFDWSFNHDVRAPESLVGYFALGGRVHRAIEAFHNGEDAVAFHEHIAMLDLAELESSSPAPWDLDQMYEDIIVGRNCVLAFLNWVATEAPYEGYVIHDVEKVIEAPILGGAVLLRGKADLVLEREIDGTLFVDDLKTSNRFRAGLRENFERSYQHVVYMSILRLINPERFVGGAWYTVIFKAKNMARMTSPPVERWAVPATTRTAVRKLGQIEAICMEILRMRRITLGGDFAHPAAYPTPQDSCRWCEFRQPCELVEDSPDAAADMLDERFEKGHKHRRYELDPS